MKIRPSRPVLFTLVALLAVSGAAYAHHRDSHPFFDEADANKDQKVTREEAKKFSDARFAEADTDKDGFLTSDEMKNAFAHHGKFKEHAEEKFVSKDTNKDGKLTRDEVPRMPEKWFKSIDKNGDGGLTREEFAASWSERHANHEGKHHGGPMAHADADNDGKISKVEATAMGEKMFARMDSNSDGVITKDEVKGHHHGRHHGCHDDEGEQHAMNGREGGPRGLEKSRHH